MASRRLTWKNQFELLSTLRSVHVERAGAATGYVWTVTFLSEAPAVTSKKLVVNFDASTTDTVTNMVVATPTPGTAHSNYDSGIVSVDDSSQTFFTYTMTDLTPGQAYYVEVSAANTLGYSAPQTSLPVSLAPPKQKPSEPNSVSLGVNSGQSLKILWKHPVSNGGDSITKYKVEWDVNASFDSDGLSSLGSHTKLLTAPATTASSTNATTSSEV